MENKQYPRVTHILQGTGLVDLSRIRPDVLEASSKFGTAVHRATELWDLDTLDIDKLSAPLVPYLESWKKFKADYKIQEFIAIEKHVISEKWQYQGTLDRIADINGKLTLIDIKSSDTVLPATDLQTAGYKIAWEEETKQRIRQRWCVQVLESGYNITEFQSKTDETVFLSCVTLYNFKKGKGLL